MKVGDELRYPATMTSLYGGSVLSLGGIDGSVFIATEARGAWAEEKIQESITTTTTMGPLRRAFPTKIFDREALASGLAEIDHVEERRVKTHVAPPGDACLSLLRGKHRAMEARDKERSLGTRMTSSAAAAAITAQQAASAQKIRELDEGVEREKIRLQRLREAPEEKGKDANTPSSPPHGASLYAR